MKMFLLEPVYDDKHVLARAFDIRGDERLFLGRVVRNGHGRAQPFRWESYFGGSQGEVPDKAAAEHMLALCYGQSEAFQ
jgi:hypothetical protein